MMKFFCVCLFRDFGGHHNDSIQAQRLIFARNHERGHSWLPALRNQRKATLSREEFFLRGSPFLLLCGRARDLDACGHYFSHSHDASQDRW
jgi:hypothetical protein